MQPTPSHRTYPFTTLNPFVAFDLKQSTESKTALFTVSFVWELYFVFVGESRCVYLGWCWSADNVDRIRTMYLLQHLHAVVSPATLTAEKAQRACQCYLWLKPHWLRLSHDATGGRKMYRSTPHIYDDLGQKFWSSACIMHAKESKYEVNLKLAGKSSSSISLIFFSRLILHFWSSDNNATLLWMGDWYPIQLLIKVWDNECDPNITYCFPAQHPQKYTMNKIWNII